MTTEELRALDARVAEVVMGLDLTAHDPESIGEAVMDGMWSSNGPACTMHVEWAGHGFKHIPFVGQYGDTATGNNAYGFNLWNIRKGKPWQSAIETHVAAWRRQPARYSTHWYEAGRVIERMRELGWQIFVSEVDDRTRWGFRKGANSASCERPSGRDEEAICLAAIAAVEGE